MLARLNMRYQETEGYGLSVVGGVGVSIESVQGIAGLHVVKFGGEHPVN